MLLYKNCMSKIRRKLLLVNKNMNYKMILLSNPLKNP